MEMSSQDFMSRAAENLQLYMTEKEGHEKTASDLASKIEELAQQKVDVIDMKQAVNNLEMKSEDYHSLIAFQLVEDIKRMTNDNSSLNSQLTSLENLIEANKKYIQESDAIKDGLTVELAELNKEHTSIMNEFESLKRANEKLEGQIGNQEQMIIEQKEVLQNSEKQLQEQLDTSKIIQPTKPASGKEKVTPIVRPITSPKKAVLKDL